MKRQSARKKEDLLVWIFVMLIALLLIEHINPIVCSCVCICTGIFLIRAKSTTIKRKYKHSKLAQIDKMEGKQFEEYLAVQFRKKGYRVSLTPDTNDYGADLVMTKGRKKYVVQAKRYKGKIGNSAVQEIVAAKAYYNAKHAMVVTNSFYSYNARELARVNDVELWDRNRLCEEFQLKKVVV